MPGGSVMRDFRAIKRAKKILNSTPKQRRGLYLLSEHNR